MDLAEKNPWYAAGQRQILTFHSKPSPKEPMFRPSPKEPIFFVFNQCIGQVWGQLLVYISIQQCNPEWVI